MAAVERGFAGRLSVAVLTLCLACMAGCAQAPRPSPPPPPDSGERDGVQVHAWTPASQAAHAPWQGPRTLLYTYVLSGDAGGNDGAGGSPARAEAQRAVAILLREIQASQRAGSIGEAGLLRRANQFILPARRYGTGRFDLEHYDFALAAGYLDRFRVALPAPEYQRRLAGLGPFLVATRRPLDELVRLEPDGQASVDSAAAILLVDMTGRSPEAMPAYVNAFKEAVQRALPSEVSTFEPLRAAFASGVLRFAEALPFVAEAYASTRKLLGPGAEGGAPK